MPTVPLGPLLRALGRRPSALVFVTVEVALGFAILASCLGFTALFDRLLDRDVGVRSSELVQVEVEPRRALPAPADQVPADLARLAGIPGVRAVASSNTPLFSRATTFERRLVGRALRIAPEAPRVPPLFRVEGDPALGEVLGAELVAGRHLAAADLAAEGPVPAVISDALREELFGDRPGLGEHVPLQTEPRGVVVVGIVRRLEVAAMPDAALPATLLLPAPPCEWCRGAAYFVRVEPGAADRVAAQAEHLLGDELRAARATPLAERERYFESLGRGLSDMVRFALGTMVGVVLLGTLGVVTLLVEERRREIGLRRALGANRADVAAWFVVETLVLCGSGLLAGLPVAFGLERVLRIAAPNLRVGPAELGTSALVLLAAALAASLAPARRASTVSPTQALVDL